MKNYNHLSLIYTFWIQKTLFIRVCNLLIFGILKFIIMIVSLSKQNKVFKQIYLIKDNTED